METYREEKAPYSDCFPKVHYLINSFGLSSSIKIPAKWKHQVKLYVSKSAIEALYKGTKYPQD